MATNADFSVASNSSVLLPATPPASPYLMALMITVIIMILHVPIGSAASGLGVIVPTVTSWAVAKGWNPAVFASIVMFGVWAQFFFAYENAGVLMAYGYGHFKASDVLKIGIVLFFLVPLVIAFVGVPFWQLIGAL